MRDRRDCFLAIVLSLLSSVSYSATESIKYIPEERPVANAIPVELNLQRTGENSAVITARFANRQPGGEVALMVGKERAVLSDSGDKSDLRRIDGLFSVETEFDFDALTKTVHQFAERHGKRERPLFSAVGRQVVGSQTVVREGDNLIITERRHNQKAKQFVLPLDIRQIKIGQSIPLPVQGIPLALPSDAGRLTPPASIPHSIMITDLDVVNDPSRTWSCSSGGQAPAGDPLGEWTFWSLMSNMANGTASTSEFIKDFFNNWNSQQTVNNDHVLPRPNIYDEIIREWEIRSGGVGAALQPEESPFRLLGIMPRLDLRGGSSPYSGGDAGEGRFVFSLHDGDCNTMSKTIILEYKVPLAGCTDVRGWAQRWKALGSSLNYNSDLADLTELFTAAGANPSAPNGSAISQIRTNEQLPGSPGWQLREFVLHKDDGFLKQTTVKQEPQLSYNNSQPLADYVNQHWQALVLGKHEITLLDDQGDHFLAGAAPAPLLWSVPNGSLTVPNTPVAGVPMPALPDTYADRAMFELAVNTCSGCHVTETGTPFAHLDYNTPPGQEAFLSNFLTGTTLPDPRNAAIPRQFADLARRAVDMDDVAAMSCLKTTEVLFGNALLHELSVPAALQATH